MSSRTSSEILEMISAAETLVLLSSATSWTKGTIIHNPSNKKAVTFRLPCSNINRPSVVAKYEDDDYVPRSSSFHSRSRKKRKAPNAALSSQLPPSSSSSSSSSHCHHELETFALPPKKRKRIAKSEEDVVKKNTIKKQADQGPIPPPDVPDNVKSLIDAMGGTRLVLITQKLLTATDVSHHQNRLQIPFSQIAHKDFLTDDEKHCLTTRDETDKCNCIETPLLDPALKPHNINLRMWAMAKNSGSAKSTQVYALTKPWISIVRSNRLREGDVVQVWGFRVGQQLQMALLKL